MNTSGNINSLYRRLDKLGQEIRLLEIANSPSPGSTPEFVLCTASLNTNPRFVALSYVWGNPTITEEINVNGYTMEVTTNLALALRLVWESRTTSKRLWIDAVCINQADSEERNHQVSLMKIIYSSAEIVIGWIGEANEQIVRGMRSMAQVANTLRNLSGDELYSLKWLANLPTSSFADPKSPISQDSGDDRSMWLDIESFLNVPYWRRVWIFQELVLGRTVVISCGQHSIMLDAVLAVCIKFEEIFRHEVTQREVKDPRRGVGSEYHRLQVRWMRIGNYPVLTKMMNMFRVIISAKQRQKEDSSNYCAWDMRHSLGELQATDPKDHIYGLLGVSGLDITPDYSTDTSVATVYRDFTAAWLNHLHSRNCAAVRCRQSSPLTFLNRAGIGILENTCRLPTWAPNYHDLAKSVGRKPSPTRSNFAADKGVFDPGMEKSSIVGVTLGVIGVGISPVTHLGPYLSVEEKGNCAKIDRPEKLLSYIAESLDPNAVYPDGRMILRAFVQLIPGLYADHANIDCLARILFLLMLFRSLRGQFTVRDILRILQLEPYKKLLLFLGDDDEPVHFLAQFAKAGDHLIDSLEAAAFVLDETVSAALGLAATYLSGVGGSSGREESGWVLDQED